MSDPIYKEYDASLVTKEVMEAKLASYGAAMGILMCGVTFFELRGEDAWTKNHHSIQLRDQNGLTRYDPVGAMATASGLPIEIVEEILDDAGVNLDLLSEFNDTITTQFDDMLQRLLHIVGLMQYSTDALERRLEDGS